MIPGSDAPQVALQRALMLNLALRRKPIGLIGATLLTLVVAALDYSLGYRLILAVYYMFPILLAACGFMQKVVT